MQLDARLAVPGPAGTTVLVDHDGRLPAVILESGEEDMAVVAVDAFLRGSWAFTAPVLETHPRWVGVPDGAPIPTLATTERAPADWTPPDGLTFAPLPIELDGLPASIRPRALELLEELRTGAPPPALRPRWARPGWMGRATAWMGEAAEGAGRPLTGEPRPFFLRGISALLRAPTDDADLFLKAVFPPFHAEPDLTQLLAERFPATVPRVLAIEADEGWLLVEDVRAPWVGDLPEAERPAALAAGARAIVGVQLAMADRPADLAALAAGGAQHRPLAGVPAAFAAAIGPDGMVVEDRSWGDGEREALVATVTAAVTRVEGLGVPETLVHGDYHSGNAGLIDGRIVIIDWSDAAVGSPLVDLVTWISWSEDRVAEIDAAVDAWIDAWSPVMPASRLRERLDDILVAGAAYQVISYDGIRRGLEPATRYTMTGGGDHFLGPIERAARDAAGAGT